MFFKSIPGIADENQEEDPRERFEGATIGGWCVISSSEPSERTIEFGTLDGGVDADFIQIQVAVVDSGTEPTEPEAEPEPRHGNEYNQVDIIVWGQ